MLVELDIQNFAIIKNLKIKFKKNMTVLIGETGAGKNLANPSQLLWDGDVKSVINAAVNQL